MRLLQTIVFGLVTGSFLIVATLGFALISRVEKFLNIAHAELISMSAFLTFFLQVRQGWNLVAAAVVSILATSVAALLVARLFYVPIKAAGSVVLLITSVGVVFVIHGLIEALIRPGVYSFQFSNFDPITLGAIRIQVVDLVIVGLAIVSVLALHAFLGLTRAGLAVRALANDEGLAAGRGVNVRGISMRVWLVSGGLAGLAGVLLGLRGALNTDMAFGQILLILSVSILAGLGSIFGVVAAGLVLGLAMDLSTLVIPTGYRTAIAFAMVILVLIVRPEGLSGSQWARREA
jgi:branched-chain amino acid transport system permease protein